MSDELTAEDLPAGHARRTVRAIVAMMAYQGFVGAINAVASHWIALSFGLGDSQIAALFAWISVSALGALALSWVADRVGRRRILGWCMIATPLCALGAALSTTLLLLAVCEICMYAFIGGTVAASIVMLAEALPIEARARGQSYGGLGAGLGGGICVITMPLLLQAGYSWRWLFVAAASGIFVLPWVARAIPESHRWQLAAASGATRRRVYEVFDRAYRRRAVTLMICSFLGTIAGEAVGSWSYFHAVSTVGLAASTASALTVIGGGVGILGFPLGAWSSERFGRVPTVVTAGLVGGLGALAFYWGPPSGFADSALWLGASFAWFSGAGNASTVAAYAAVTELFPTALRGTMMGWFALIAALGAVSSETTLALLTVPLGSLSTVVGYLALLGVPSAVIFGLSIEETRGRSLEVVDAESGSLN